MKENKTQTLKERYIATLVGCGIGDALGMPVEAWRKEQIQKYAPNGRITELIDPIIVRDNEGNIITNDEFGKIRYWTSRLKKGEYTDDTVLTLSIAESIAELGKLDLEDITKKQVEAYKSCKLPDGTNRESFGGTTMEAFEKILLGESLYNSGVFPGLGNAPPMKMSPIGLYMHAKEEYDKGLEIARLIGESTHKDERAVAAGIVQAHVIYNLLKFNNNRKMFLDMLVRASKKYEKPLSRHSALSERGTLTSKLKWIQNNKNADCDNAFGYLGNSGLAFESYPFTIFMFQKYWDSPLEGLIETINYGGDCDTTGAMFGALAGAKNGIFFPDEWLEVLQNKERLKNAAEQIYEIRRKK